MNKQIYVYIHLQVNTYFSVYCVEAILKIMGKGPKEYFTNGWDM